MSRCTILFITYLYANLWWFAQGQVDYARAINASLLFYEAQRSGQLPENNRIPWRSDSLLYDRGPNGEDLTGGYYDAGDHVKFTHPLAVSMGQLAWGIIEFEEGYKSAGQLDIALDTLKWGLDWLVKAHLSNSTLVLQVGNGSADHAYLGPPERYTLDRPVFTVDTERPGTEVAASVAAAMAAGAIVFELVDDLFTAELLKHAEQLYNFAKTYRDSYNFALPPRQRMFYKSTNYIDDLLWSAVWMYDAFDEREYLDDALEFLPDAREKGQYSPNFDWDNMYWGAVVKLLALDDRRKDNYTMDFNRFVGAWVHNSVDIGVRYTSEGFACLPGWGVNRNTANAAFLILIGSRSITSSRGPELRCWAKYQIDFLLGDNPRDQSYVVGYGSKFPRRPHHRAATCPDWENTFCDRANFNEDKDNPHVLTGALVLGNCSTEFYNNRTDFVTNEVALDVNPCFTGALAALKYYRLRCTGDEWQVPPLIPFENPAAPNHPTPPSGNRPGQNYSGPAAPRAPAAPIDISNLDSVDSYDYADIFDPEARQSVTSKTPLGTPFLPPGAAFRPTAPGTGIGNSELVGGSSPSGASTLTASLQLGMSFGSPPPGGSSINRGDDNPEDAGDTAVGLSIDKVLSGPGSDDEEKADTYDSILAQIDPNYKPSPRPPAVAPPGNTNDKSLLTFKRPRRSPTASPSPKSITWQLDEYARLRAPPPPPVGGAANAEITNKEAQRVAEEAERFKKDQEKAAAVDAANKAADAARSGQAANPPPMTDEARRAAALFDQWTQP